MKYYNVLVRLPGLIIFAVLFFTLFSLVVVSFFYEDLNFSDPQEGIASRKTEISNNIHSLSMLNSSKDLSPIPFAALQNINVSQPVINKHVECAPRNWKNLFKVLMETTESDGTMLDVAHVKSLCKYGDRLTSHKLVNKTCGMISLVNVIHNLTGATCDSVTDEDITRLQEVLGVCAPLYHSGVLEGRTCTSASCLTVHPDCFKVFDLFYYFSDDSFYDDESSNLLKRTLIMFALEDSTSSTASKFYIDVFAVQPYQSEGNVKVIGLDSGVKSQALNFQLLFDFVYWGAAFLIIGIIMTIYLRSLVMTLIAAVDIGLSLVLAYFIYVGLLQIRFFPFLNLLGGLILIALVADDVFLFIDTLETMKKRYPDESLEFHMKMTFRHAGMSIFVTSLTTSASFFSNIVSAIPALKFFGIYSGLCIVANFMLMCTFIPACMVLLEKSKMKKMQDRTSNTKKPCLDLSPMYKKVSKIADYVFTVALPKMINSMYPVFIIGLLGIGVASAVCVFYKPMFSLPSDASYQAFVTRHPITVYEKLIPEYTFYRVEQNSIMMPAIFVWGVDPKDTGSIYKRNDLGDLFLNDDFDLTVYRNQQWISNICEILKKNYLSTRSSICTMTDYLDAVGKCNSRLDPCCCVKESPECFTKCFPAFMTNLYATAQKEIIGIPYFNKKDEVKAFVMQFLSDYQFVLDYNAVKKFYDYHNEQLLSIKQNEAPDSIKNVFFTSYLSFFDTQAAFLDGAFTSAGISIGICFMCVLLTTGNVVITFYSILNIAQATLAMYACMILMKWKLNFMESIILSLALGLTIDFVIHFGVAYLLSQEKTREKKVKDVLSLVGSPAAMAAITTFMTGLAMSPVTTYCYFQTGVFLMMIMVISIIYSIFFFLSVCRFIGPLGNFGQIPCCCVSKANDTDSNSSSNGSNKQLVKNENIYKYSSKPIYHVSKGSMYDTIDGFLKTDQQTAKHVAKNLHSGSKRQFPSYTPKSKLISNSGRNSR